MILPQRTNLYGGHGCAHIFFARRLELATHAVLLASSEIEGERAMRRDLPSLLTGHCRIAAAVAWFATTVGVALLVAPIQTLAQQQPVASGIPAPRLFTVTPNGGKVG